MNIFYGVLLGLVQGFTEFLPVSSSGHLVLVQSLLPQFKQPGVLLDVILHVGTAAAILVYFRWEIIKLTFSDIKYLIIGSIPAAFVGILFQSFIEELFLSTFAVGVALLFTAVMNFLTDRSQARREKMNYIDALIIGIGQAVAVVPGISRSGATIFAGTSMGVDRKKAAQFSFLLSIPAIFGAALIQLFSHSDSNTLPIIFYLLGFVTAFFSGLVAIALVFRLLTQKKFIYFSIYAFLVGIIAILL